MGIYMDPEIFLLIKISQTQKDKYYVFSHVLSLYLKGHKNVKMS